ncbi:TcpJ [Clostridium perfringens]|uniref:TcpJ n=1 Tax=Clostridium perfringens TaxID=1502 RepID=UPI001123EBCB|nr:TcpJ [Clostridium perfringens]MBO3304599.1 TcpJ [Clostridium perfringens]MBO3307916.1 TcpJ [Clostridium perfringens]MBO3311262.1 TcpJ [Clostridium perfringens]MBO3317596.1 TcpJ [Clostridium perfringens]MBO3392713.1 TcpJ [Clostridium perfringens]
MRKRLIFVGLICLSLFAFMGCGTEKLDISNCIDVSYGKYNGKAKIYENSIDTKKLMQIPKLQKLTPDMLKGDYKITLVGDKTDLKNGDKVKLHLEYNKELYKRDFDVEFTFEPKEITIEGLPDELTDIKQISKEQWEEIYKLVSKQAEEEAAKNNYKDLKLERVLEFQKDKERKSDKINSNGITINFIYSYKNSQNEIRYFSLSHLLEFKVNNVLDNLHFQESDIWKNPLMVDYSKALDEILKDIYKKSNYKVIWSAN